MPGLADTIARLAGLREATAAYRAAPGGTTLQAVDGFGPNPGALRGMTYVPEGLGRAAPLVVVLHGCTQTAPGYDAGSGWSQLANRYGFALLFPEQQRRNNPNLCFNWFSPEDNGRERGEAASIRQMIEAMVTSHELDPRRVYVTGLSAGGAMAATMLATYPELFAGGAIIAGLPYACAENVPQAFERMRGHGMPGEAALKALVRRASSHDGPWPTISVWQGTTDRTVNPLNADAIVAQWRGIHGLDREASRIEVADGYPRRVWCDQGGREVIEQYTVTGMGHGTPLATTGADACGTAGPFMLEAGISSSHRICRFWGLADARDEREARHCAPDSRELVRAADGKPRDEPFADAAPERPMPHRAVDASGVGKVIEDALRAAGLLR
jgi:poly(hydroxyalkanoate) depolymerase family esterase